ncbi:MAG TPA: ABC transporter ATP-binding protein [Actinomycetota bacterium]
MSDDLRPASDHLLEVDHLDVRFFTRRGEAHAVRGISFTIDRGETLGLVGESGSGKSVTSLAILGLIQLPGKITGGDVRWKGRSMLGPVGEKYAHKIRGKEMSVVFQDPMTSLNPLFTIGTQIGEVPRHHLGMNKKQARERTVELLDLVGISNPQQRVDQYPHEFSGGMRQRMLIAMALACEPEMVIADEPTTALDVTIQAQILELLADLQQRLGVAVLLISHDLGVVAQVCHRIAVMYAGKIVETGPAEGVFSHPGHPYAAGLLRSTPRLDVRQARLVGIDGAPPDLINPPTGCPFHPRCELADQRCRDEMPPIDSYDGGREVACWHAFAERVGAEAEA